MPVPDFAADLADSEDWRVSVMRNGRRTKPVGWYAEAVARTEVTLETEKPVDVLARRWSGSVGPAVGVPVSAESPPERSQAELDQLVQETQARLVMVATGSRARVRLHEQRRRRAVAVGDTVQTATEDTALVVADVWTQGRNGQRRGRASVCASGTMDALIDGQLMDVLTVAAAQSLRLTEAADLAPQRPTAVAFAPHVTGAFVHEVVGHLLEADNVLIGSGVYRGEIGSVVAPPDVTVFDDGRAADEWGSTAFDDEGTPGQVTTLIDAGRLSGWLTDRETCGQLAGARLTGNGRRCDHLRPVLPRMTRTGLCAGSISASELIGSISHGLLVEDVSVARVQPRDGKFVVHVQEAHRIENGRLGEPVGGFALVGHSREALAQVIGVGNDFDWCPALCMKAGQELPTAFGGPTCLVGSLQAEPTGSWY